MPASQRILIVDGDPVTAEALSERLAGWGHTTACAADAEQALAMLDDAAYRAAEPFGVLISELDLPREDGLDLVKRLRATHEDIVPILMTGFGKVETAVRAMRLGAADYLMKPLIEDELREAVDKAVQKHALLAEDRAAGLRQQTVPGVSHTKEADAGPADTSPGEASDAMATTTRDDWTPMPLVEALKEPERRILLAALEHNGWNRQQTARQLGINRTTLYKKIKQHRLDEPG